jgi:SAM-dependent methyltransferase
MSPITNRLYPHWWEDQRYPLTRLRQTIVGLFDGPLRVGPGVRVVDLGSGEAPYRSLFEAAGAEYVTADLGGDAEVEIRPGEPVPIATASADVVVSFQVLEHVWDLDWYLGECQRLLKPNGVFVLSTHGVWLYHPHPVDFRRWTRDGLLEELRTRGFELVELHALVGPLAWLLNLYLLAASVMLDRLGRFGRVLFVPLGTIVNLLLPLQDRLTPRWIRDENAAIYLTVSRAASGADFLPAAGTRSGDSP